MSSRSRNSASKRSRSSKQEESDGTLGMLRLQSSIDDLKCSRFYAALVAEMIGTLLLVFLGSASTLYGGNRIDIALAFGLAVATSVWAIAHVSGGHINPAVSAGMLFCRKISLVRFVLYVVVQCLGAYLGAAFCAFVEPSKHPIAVTALRSGITGMQGGVIEMIITGMLVFTVFATCDQFRGDLDGSGPLAIGLSVTLGHFAFVPVTGPSMNPARSFGPALYYGKWANQGMYWFAPLLGGLLAGAVYEFVFSQGACLERIKDWLCARNYEARDEERQVEEEILKDIEAEED